MSKDQSKKTKMKSSISKESFGLIGDREVFLYTMKNDKDMSVSITNYGGIITSIQVPDQKGNIDDVVLGFDNLEQYLDEHPYFGAIIGRYGNRIANGRFELEGKSYNLAINNGPNSLHGGINGFDKKVWKAQEINKENNIGLRLSTKSEDGEEGYPGTLDVVVTYTLTEENELIIEYQASTDRPTIINLTNHSYFNLNGEGNGDVMDHLLTLKANYYTPVDSTLIPTGQIEDVKGGPFDFTISKTIRQNINANDTQIQYGGGYDHNFVLDENLSFSKPKVTVYHPISRRKLEVFTTEPGVQFYTGNFLDGSLIGKRGKAYNKRFGFCLETQHFPDSPNQPSFPSTVLTPKKDYRSTTIYKFSTE